MSTGNARVLVGAARREAEHRAMVQQAKTALREWHRACNGDSADAEYVAACGMEHALSDLVRALS